LLLYKYYSRAPLILGGFTALSLTICIIGTVYFPSASFYLLPTRAWEFSIGGLLALCPLAMLTRNIKSWAIEFLPAIGLGLIFLSFYIVKGGNSFPGYDVLLPVFGTILVLAFTNKTKTLAGFVLQQWPMTMIGRISYSLYLWHWPVNVFLKRMQDHPTAPIWMHTEWPILMSLIITALLSITSYYLLEKPLRVWHGTPVFAGSAFIGLVLSVVFCDFLPARPLLKESSAMVGFAPVTTYGQLYSANPKSELAPSVQEKYKKVQMPLPVEKGILRTYGSASIDVLVFGDSHALALANSINNILINKKLTGCFICADAVSPELFRKSYRPIPSFGSSAELEAYDNVRRKFLEQQKPKLVIWIQRYISKASMKGSFDSIKLILAQSKCLFIQQVPILNIGDVCTVDAFEHYCNFMNIPPKDLNICEKNTDHQLRLQLETSLLSHFDGNKGFLWFDTNKFFVNKMGRIKWWDGINKLYYVDDDHLSDDGAGLLQEELQNIIVETLSTPS
jgi:hypothetical protein